MINYLFKKLLTQHKLVLLHMQPRKLPSPPIFFNYLNFKIYILSQMRYAHDECG